MRLQRNVPADLQNPGFGLIKEDETGILKCKGRIPGHQTTYIQGRLFGETRPTYMYTQTNHAFRNCEHNGIQRNDWWIPELRSKIKKIINKCNTCKIYRVEPYEPSTTTAMPTFRTKRGKPFQTTGVDFACPLSYKIAKQQQGKCYIVIFTCATSRTVHLEMTAEEFQRKLNVFIARRKRPQLIISERANSCKTT